MSHRSLIARCLPEGNAELLRISAGDEPIGYLYNFIWRGWIGTYMSGFAYEDDARLKPGLVSYYLCAERHLADGMRVQDFLAGAYRYKTSLGKPGPDMVWLALQRPRLRFRLEAALSEFLPEPADAVANRARRDARVRPDELVLRGPS